MKRKKGSEGKEVQREGDRETDIKSKKKKGGVRWTQTSNNHFILLATSPTGLMADRQHTVSVFASIIITCTCRCTHLPSCGGTLSMPCYLTVP
jgi:hypothetical protein